MKLRKHLRTRKLDSLTQLGVDRVIDFQFGSSIDNTYHVLLELYAGGNIVLTDGQNIILALLRPYQIEEKDGAGDDGEGGKRNVQVRERYPIDLIKQPSIINEQSVLSILQNANPVCF